MKKQVGLAVSAGLLAFCCNGLAQFVPGGASSVGLTNVVPDVPIWYDSVSNRVRIGPIVPLANQVADQGNWEPSVSVVGEKVFLIQTDKYADDGTASLMRYILSFQPARPGTWADARLGECFYDDSGKPYTNGISSRQDGNPGQVYGDRRYNATNFVTGGEANPQAYPGFFNSNHRFDTTLPVYSDASFRCGLVQTFSLNLTTLTQQPLCKAFDAGALDCAACLQGPGNTQRGRFGGGLAALDDGNFVALIDDRSGYWPPGNGNEAPAAAFKPDGTAVRGTWLAAPNEAWTPPCGFKGGFCIRMGINTDAALYFYDNSANPVATNFANAASGLTMDTGRGDGSNGQWGWGEPLTEMMAPIPVINGALGGRSSRTFLTGGNWDATLAILKAGDVLLMQFGHNDDGPLDDKARARGTLPGVGEETREIDNPVTGQHETVHTYGYYLRRFIREAKARGVKPAVCSPIPRNIWKDGKVERRMWAQWAGEVARSEGVPFLDLESRIASRYEELGREKVSPLFVEDHTHTGRAGAEINAQIVAQCENDMAFGFRLLRKVLATVADRLRATRLQLLDVYAKRGGGGQ